MAGLQAGPQTAFAGLSFSSNPRARLAKGGVTVRSKNQDFALSKLVFLRASTDPSFAGKDVYQGTLNVACLAAECKTNLDSTMWNEAVETSRALKQAVSGARYLLLCEWLDMKPKDTLLTDIDEVIILRKAKRMGADFRKVLDTAAGRKSRRDEYVSYYVTHPLSLDSFRRIVHHLNAVFPAELSIDEEAVLQRGYF